MKPAVLTNSVRNIEVENKSLQVIFALDKASDKKVIFIEKYGSDFENQLKKHPGWEFLKGVTVDKKNPILIKDEWRDALEDAFSFFGNCLCGGALDFEKGGQYFYID